MILLLLRLALHRRERETFPRSLGPALGSSLHSRSAVNLVPRKAKEDRRGQCRSLRGSTDRRELLCERDQAPPASKPLELKQPEPSTRETLKPAGPGIGPRMGVGSTTVGWQARRSQHTNQRRAQPKSWLAMFGT